MALPCTDHGPVIPVLTVCIVHWHLVYNQAATILKKKAETQHQNAFFIAATANALTTVFAGLAFTIVSLPKISFFPALVAGFLRVLILQTPGKVKTLFFFSSAVAISARLARTIVASFFLSSHPVARASAKAPLPITAAFIATAFALGAMPSTWMRLAGLALEPQGLIRHWPGTQVA